MATATISPALLRQRFRTARDLLDTSGPCDDVSRFPIRLDACDRLLDGGLARGELVELVGRRSCGRFSIVLAALTAATSMGESTALVDLGDHFDPQQAITRGLALERLLWIRPRRLKEALVCSEILIAGGFALVVLDLGMAPIGGGRGAQSSWQRLQKAARDRKGTLLLSTPYRSSGAAASTVIEARKIDTHWQGPAGSAKLLAALSSHMVLAKTRGRASGAHEKLRLSFESGAVKSSRDNVLMMPAGRSPSFRYSLLGRP